MNIVPTDPFSEEANEIIAELTSELAERYNEPGGGAFKPEDVTVQRSIFLTIREGDLTIGCGALRPVDEDTCEVKRMYVNPAYRGRGYSKEILSALEAKAKFFNYKTIILETGKRQPEALGLYIRSGYQVIANYGIYKDREMSVCFKKDIFSNENQQMDVTQLPFNKFIGLERCEKEKGFLTSLPDKPEYTNHLGTVHASALFAVAEAGSGEFLFRQFKVTADLLPVVRHAELKFRKPVKGRVSA